jgi:hypothetical protein
LLPELPKVDRDAKEDLTPEGLAEGTFSPTTNAIKTFPARRNKLERLNSQNNFALV